MPLLAALRPWLPCAMIAVAVACAPVQSPPVAAAITAGWYVQHGSTATLQPCGTADALAVAEGGKLRTQAAAFGLQDDLPVYVRVHGQRAGGMFRLDAVEQFGSPKPVRDCPMSGTSIQQ